MIFSTTLLVAGLVGALVPRSPMQRFAPAFLATTAALLVGALAADVAVSPPDALVDVVERIDALAIGGRGATARWSLLAALVWCGPAGDLLVRVALDATGLPTPEAAARAGISAGRWIGRFERWLLVLVVAAGQPTLAIIPTGGKAVLRYAETVADARSAAPRLRDDAPRPSREALIDYVLVGSLASWLQGIGLGLLVAAAS